MQFTIECKQEEDGRWLAKVFELPGIMVYDNNVEHAIARAQALALRIIADRLEHSETVNRVMDIALNENQKICKPQFF